MSSYHMTEAGDPKLCKATKGKCPYGSSSQHHGSQAEARKAYEESSASSFHPLTLNHGQWVHAGEVAVSDFLTEVVAKRGNQRYSGSLEELAKLTKEHLASAEAGTGSQDGDVQLVRLPPANFFTTIVEVNETNAHLLEAVTEARVEGEAPVTKQVLKGALPAPAKVVKIVVYRADALARDDNRSTASEWEIVAILTQPQEHVPMHPTTMERNSLHQKGGTYREYTDEQWQEAREYWATHAYVEGESAP